MGTSCMRDDTVDVTEHINHTWKKPSSMQAARICLIVCALRLGLFKVERSMRGRVVVESRSGLGLRRCDGGRTNLWGTFDNPILVAIFGFGTHMAWTMNMYNTSDQLNEEVYDTRHGCV